MLLGFISLLLAVVQSEVSKICISPDLADTMLPCRKEATESTTTKVAVRAYMTALNLSSTLDPHQIQLPPCPRRQLDETTDSDSDSDAPAAAADSDDPCASKV